jgi:hypothetical protein
MLKTQRRIDLMTQFCNRLSELDDQRLAERVRRLEEDVARLRRGERP